MVRGFLIQSLLPPQFWVDATYTAIVTINRLPTPLLSSVSPFQKLFGKVPDYTFLRTFGCACFPILSASLQNKLQPRSIHCVFIGYATQYKGYRCLDLKTKNVFTSQHVQFHDQIFPYRFLKHAASVDAVAHDKLVSERMSLTSTSNCFASSGSGVIIPAITHSHDCRAMLPSPSLPLGLQLIHFPRPACMSHPPSPVASPSPTPSNSSLPIPVSNTSPSGPIHFSCSPMFVASFDLPNSSPSPSKVSPPLSSTSSLPNVHQMQTRSKSGITKSKHILSLSSLCPETKPVSFREASQKPQW